MISIIAITTAAALAATAATALTVSLKTANQVQTLMSNITSDLTKQIEIDQMILSHLANLEAAILWLGESQQALWTRSQLDCDSTFSHVCVTV